MLILLPRTSFPVLPPSHMSYLSSLWILSNISMYVGSSFSVLFFFIAIKYT